MKGRELVKILEEEEFSVEIGANRKRGWQKTDEISPTILRNALRKLKSQALHHAIRPLMEFHYLDDDHDNNRDSLRNRLNNENVYKKLNAQMGGIYAFFDTTGEVIYVGKTTGNLFTEIQQRYNGKKDFVSSAKMEERDGNIGPLNRSRSLFQPTLWMMPSLPMLKLCLPE